MSLYQHNNDDSRVHGIQSAGTGVGSTPIFPILSSASSDIQISGKQGYIPPTADGPCKPAPRATKATIEWLPEFPESLSEPFAAVVPFMGHSRLVHLSLAPRIRSDVRPKQTGKRSPAPFVLETGRKVPFLPRYSKSTRRVSPRDLQRIQGSHLEYHIAANVEKFGVDEFLLQVERARAFLRGPRFLALKPLRSGYSAYGLKHQAEKDGAGAHCGYVCEMALIVAALLDRLKHQPHPRGENAVVYR